MGSQSRTSSYPLRLEDVLQNPRIPTLPVVALQVIELTRSNNVNLIEVARVIQNDQALALKIIRTVNSSFYGLSRPCTTIKQAIVYLGLNAVKTLALGFSLVDSIDGGGDDDVSFDYVDYWRRAIYSAGAAWDIAQFTGRVDPEEAFLAALVQDVGMIAINRAFGDMYLQAIDLTDRDHNALSAIEQRTFKLTHADVGAAMVARWKLPASLIEAIRYHHRADESPEQWRELVRVVQLSYLASAVVSDSDPTRSVAAFKQYAAMWFSLDEQRCRSLLQVMSESAGELAQLFRVETGPKTDIDAVLAQAEQAQIQHEGGMLTEAARIAVREAGSAGAGSADPLAHLAGPKQFQALLAKACDRTRQRNGALAIILVAIDELATLRRTDGPEAAADLLAAIAGRLDRQVGAFGIVARPEEDLLVVMLPHTDRRLAAHEAETLRQIVETEYTATPLTRDIETSRDSSGVTASFGVAALEPELDSVVPTPESLIRLAIRALAEAREAGGNCVRTVQRHQARHRAA